MHLGTEYESSLTRTQGREDNNNSDMNLKPVNDLPFLFFFFQLALRKCGNIQSWKSAIGDVTKGNNSCLFLSSTPREAQLMHGHLVLGSFNMQEGPTKHQLQQGGNMWTFSAGRCKHEAKYASLWSLLESYQTRLLHRTVA